MSATILVVDDSATDRLIIKNMLAGYTVLLANDGVEALKVLHEQPDIDLMILDLNMPNMNGFEVLETLRNSAPTQMRTIILTNYDELENEIRGLHLGAVDYIRKPVHMDSLRARIDVHALLLQTHKALTSQLHASSLTLDTVLEQAPIGIAISRLNDPYKPDEGHLISVNAAFERITGRAQDELNSLGWAHITHLDDIAEDVAKFEQLKSGAIQNYSLEKRLIKPDETVVWVDVTVARLSVGGDDDYGYICLIQDATQRKTAEHALAESERSKSVLLSNLQGMAYRCAYDQNWTMQFVSSGCFDLTGYEPESLINNRELSFNEVITPEYRDLLWNEWANKLPRHEPFRYEYEITTAQGERKWVLEIGQGVFDASDTIEALEGIIIDISDRKGMESSLRYISEHDEFTGLFNRRVLVRDLEANLLSGNPVEGFLISIDLSGLYALTLSYGFQYSQNVIKEVGQALSEWVGNDCQLYNTYEYRFVFYTRGHKTQDEVVEFCEQIQQVLNALLVVDRVPVGIGALDLSLHGTGGAEQILKNLLIASEEALDAGNMTNCACFYNDEMAQRVAREEALKREIALVSAETDSKALTLHFQPILNLKTNTISGFEALVRLKSEKLGMVPPLEFIPLAEETKHIIPIGDQIIRKACQFIRLLEKNDLHDSSVAINISPIQLLEPNFANKLLAIIESYQVRPSQVVIELTESIFSSRFEEINEILGVLNDRGIRCSIDDFGTGYSSLSRERELNVSCLKIDKSFIDRLVGANHEETITGDIISMAHRLGHYVIAEGVEHEEQLKYLKEHDCDRVQGYLISKPLEIDDALEFAKNAI